MIGAVLGLGLSRKARKGVPTGSLFLDGSPLLLSGAYLVLEA